MSLMKNFNTAAIRQGFVIDDVSIVKYLHSIKETIVNTRLQHGWYVAEAFSLAAQSHLHSSSCA